MNRLRILMILAAAFMLLCASTLSAQVGEYGAAEAYVVKKGDTAASIAKRHYGKSSLGAKLWQANKNLVAHPKRLTVGDTIYLFPESSLVANKATAVPPPPLEKPTELYDRGRILDTTFPKFFNFVADGRGLGESGAVRIRVKKTVKEPLSEDAGYDVDELYEVREVGYIISSSEHPGLVYGDGADKAFYRGKVMLSTNDEIIIQFTEDLAKILDSETYGDSDPYFREFPIYGRSYSVTASDKRRSDYNRNLGEIYAYRGMATVVARVEGLAPMPPKVSKSIKKKKNGKNQDIEPVSYVARITSAVDAIDLDDSIFIFVPLMPGPERVLDPPFVESPDTYVSLGN